jgi:hypothetical protein
VLKSLPAVASDDELLEFSRVLLERARELAAEDAAADALDAGSHTVGTADCTRSVPRRPRQFHEHQRWAHLAREQEIRAK